MERLGIEHSSVECQNASDFRFNDMKSPNPENKEASKVVVEKARALKHDIVLVTDPDNDRAAVVAKTRAESLSIFLEMLPVPPCGLSPVKT
jgi:phosphomannomutase